MEGLVCKQPTLTKSTFELKDNSSASSPHKKNPKVENEEAIEETLGKQLLWKDHTQHAWLPHSKPLSYVPLFQEVAAK